jgi:hypothetical protein
MRPRLHRRRLASGYSEVLPDKRKESAVPFLERALAFVHPGESVVARLGQDSLLLATTLDAAAPRQCWTLTLLARSENTRAIGASPGYSHL